MHKDFDEDNFYLKSEMKYEKVWNEIPPKF